MTARVLVIGAGGVLGRAIADRLEAEQFTVRRGVRHPEAASEVTIELDDPRSVEVGVEGVDLVINAVPHAGCAPERIVRRDGGLLLNVSSLSRASGAALSAERDDEPRGCVVLHGGLVPGVSSLVARDLIESHAEADEIGIGMMFSSRGVSGHSGAMFAFDALAARAHHATRRIDVGELGSRTAFEVLPEERGWLGSIADGRRVRVYVSFAERPLHAALAACNTAWAMRALPRRAFVRTRGKPNALTSERIVEWVGVIRSSRLIDARAIACRGDYRATAGAVVPQARALLATDRARPGVWAIDDMVFLDDIRAGLDAEGITITSVS